MPWASSGATYSKAPCDPGLLAAAALYHDAPEILTGDMPTPIKYHSGRISSAYHEVERARS